MTRPAMSKTEFAKHYSFTTLSNDRGEACPHCGERPETLYRLGDEWVCFERLVEATLERAA